MKTTKTKLTFGSGRFGSTVTNNRNHILVGDFDRPTKIVDTGKDVLLCLPANRLSWGTQYPTHQESWLTLNFVVACHSAHHDDRGRGLRRVAYAKITDWQWPALVAKASQFAMEFRQRLAETDLAPRKRFKSATRALQDCLLYLVERKFPEDQDKFLSNSPIQPLIEMANRGRADELTSEEGFSLADQIDHEVERLAVEFGGLEKCFTALENLMKYTGGPEGRVVLLPEGVSLEEGAELVQYSIILGIPDRHDCDVVTVTKGFTGKPKFVQLRDELSGQRLDIIQVSPDLPAQEVLEGGHRPFQSIGEMILANGKAFKQPGYALVERLKWEINPAELAQKYRAVAKEFFSDATNRKSWVSRRADLSVPQVKKVIPLYRIACDLLPRAIFMEREGYIDGHVRIEHMAEEAKLGDALRAIRNILDRQDATDEELQTIADQIEPKL